ncbi:MAG: phosphohydrolase, partial [Coprobacter sp.]|nr:phosphohydrolase [Coprobacter sp.]
LGAEILRSEGLEAHALVCERHTGAGISAQEIENQKLPLPKADMIPVSIEEKIVAYADKFFSKSSPNKRKSVAEARSSLERFGEETLKRFDEWIKLFS